MRFDFHLHTRLSDGALEPRALLAAVRRAGLDAWAVTDHDCMDAAAELAGEPGLLPACEVTAGWRAREVHVVALGVDGAHPGLGELLAEIRALRRDRLSALIARLKPAVARGLTVADCEDGRAVSLGRNHLARALVARGAVPSMQAAFDRHLGDERIADAGLPAFPAVARVAEAIRSAGGVAILAHPGLYRDPALVSTLLDEGLDGLETCHPGLDPSLAGELRRLARDRGLYASAGSDLHVLGSREPGMCALEPQDAEPLLKRLGLAGAA